MAFTYMPLDPPEYWEDEDGSDCRTYHSLAELYADDSDDDFVEFVARMG